VTNSAAPEGVTGKDGAESEPKKVDRTDGYRLVRTPAQVGDINVECIG